MSSRTHSAVDSTYPTWGTDNTWSAWGFDDLTFRRLYIPLFALYLSVEERANSPSLLLPEPWECRMTGDVYQGIGLELRRFAPIDEYLAGIGVDNLLLIRDAIDDSIFNSCGSYLNQCEFEDGNYLRWTWSDLLEKAAELTMTIAVPRQRWLYENNLPVSRLKDWAMQRYVMVNLLRWRNVGCHYTGRRIEASVPFSGSYRDAVIAAGGGSSSLTQDGLAAFVPFHRYADVVASGGTADVAIEYTYDAKPYEVLRATDAMLVFGSATAHDNDYDAFGYDDIPTTAGEHWTIYTSATATHQFITPPVPDNEHSQGSFGIANAPMSAFIDMSPCFTLYDDVEARFAH